MIWLMVTFSGRGFTLLQTPIFLASPLFRPLSASPSLHVRTRRKKTFGCRDTCQFLHFGSTSGILIKFSYICWFFSEKSLLCFLNSLELNCVGWKFVYPQWKIPFGKREYLCGMDLKGSGSAEETFHTWQAIWFRSVLECMKTFLRVLFNIKVWIIDRYNNTVQYRRNLLPSNYFHV